MVCGCSSLLAGSHFSVSLPGRVKEAVRLCSGTDLTPNFKLRTAATQCGRSSPFNEYSDATPTFTGSAAAQSCAAPKPPQLLSVLRDLRADANGTAPGTHLLHVRQAGEADPEYSIFCPVDAFLQREVSLRWLVDVRLPAQLRKLPPGSWLRYERRTSDGEYLMFNHDAVPVTLKIRPEVLFVPTSTTPEEDYTAGAEGSTPEEDYAAEEEN